MTPAGAYAGKVVLVSGGAGGIGKAAVEGFAAAGATVIFSDIAEASGAALERATSEAGGRTRFVRCDAAEEAEVETLIAGVERDFGRLDVAVNVVGAILPPDRSTGRLHETPEAGWDLTVRVCLKTAFLGMKHQIGLMLRQGGGGVIANTASLAGLHVTPNGSPAYHAAKAGVIHLSRKAAIDYAGAGIRVNVVAPGVTATEALVSRWSTEELARMSAEQPIGRPVSPDEVAAAFLWLCSDAASGTTGLVVPVDGGWNAR